MAERRAARRTAALALLCTVVVGVAGCGGSAGPSRAEAFKQGYGKQRTALNAISERIGEVLTGATGKTDAQVVSEVRGIEKQYRAQLGRLEALEPPDERAAEFAVVTKSARVLDTDLVRIADAASGGDAVGARRATEALVGHVPALKAASERLVKALGLPAIKAATASGAGTQTAAADSPSSGVIDVSFATPVGADARFAKQILTLGGTEGVARGLSRSFVLPENLRIRAVNGFVGPNYDPQTKTITLSYGFVNYVAALLRTNFPALRRDEEEFGRELAAVDGFLLMHEFGHALIDVYALPVLGKEEDAADSVATVFLTETVDNGAQYAFDAARFFHALSARQRGLAPSAYWDEHSLDEQRAYSIVCWVAGSSAANLHRVGGLGLLGDTRLRTCPREYQQKVQSWKSLLLPHVRPGS